MFHIPAEERKGLNIEGFGGGEAHKKLDAIMNNTGTKIEMSSSKDKSLTFLITGFILANLIPFFADMQGVISAFAASPIVFFYPAYFYVVACMRAGDWKAVPFWEKGWLGFMIFFVFPFCFFVGLVSSISGIASSWTGAGTPFGCIVASQL